ncbi:MAG: hypothetical protein HC860_04165 [Alkalinema sp. RU_4_3]|nr:hypothetical protein [Alkalinema sp. RU_4_3]
MSTKVSITLDDDVLSFIDARATTNRSSFINEVLWREKQRILLQELEAAYSEQSADPDFQAEVSLWDATVADGLATDA